MALTLTTFCSTALRKAADYSLNDDTIEMIRSEYLPSGITLGEYVTLKVNDKPLFGKRLSNTDLEDLSKLTLEEAFEAVNMERLYATTSVTLVAKLRKYTEQIFNTTWPLTTLEIRPDLGEWADTVYDNLLRLSATSDFIGIVTILNLLQDSDDMRGVVKEAETLETVLQAS